VQREGFALPPGFNRYLHLESYAQVLGVDPAILAEAYEQGQSLGLSEAVELSLRVAAPGNVDKAVPVKQGDQLSPREHELLGLVADGLTDAQIAETMFISIRTVRSHLDRIGAKTGARRRPDLIRLATSLALPSTRPAANAGPPVGPDARAPQNSVEPPRT
jgi:DNA-binding CsgD family transcriptional regulator